MKLFEPKDADYLFPFGDEGGAQHKPLISIEKANAQFNEWLGKQPLIDVLGTDWELELPRGIHIGYLVPYEGKSKPLEPGVHVITYTREDAIAEITALEAKIGALIAENERLKKSEKSALKIITGFMETINDGQLSAVISEARIWLTEMKRMIK